MFCTDSCNKQPLGEVLHSVEICFVTSLLNTHRYVIYIINMYEILTRLPNNDMSYIIHNLLYYGMQ